MSQYDIFMMDYIKEHNKDLDPFESFFEDIDEETFTLFDEGGKEGVYKENYLWRDEMQIPIIHEVIKKPKNRDDIVEWVGKFLDDNATKLSTLGPVYMIPFKESDSAWFYKKFEIDDKFILNMYRKVISETYYGSISKFFNGWVENAPHKIIVIAMLIDALQNGYEDIIECCYYLLIFCEYPLAYRHFWQTGVNEEVMAHTVEHLGARFKITKYKNLKEFLYNESVIAVNRKLDTLKSGADNAYLDMLQSVHQQIFSSFRKISNNYYSHVNANNTQHSNQTQFDDGSIVDNEGHTTNAAAIIEKTINKFSKKDINKSMIRICADGRKVDKGNLEGFISQIYATKNNMVNKIVESIINAYFVKNPTALNVDSNEFLVFGFGLYKSIGTSKDENLQNIKSILSFWMNDIINIKSQYNREATVISYTHAVFDYIVLMIHNYN